MGKKALRKKSQAVKKAEEDDQSSSNSRKNIMLRDIVPNKEHAGIKKPIDKKNDKKRLKKNLESSESSESQSSSSATSDSQSIQGSRSRRLTRSKKIPNSIKDYLDISASSSSGQEAQSIDSQDAEQKRREFQENYDRLYKSTKKTKNEELLENLAGKSGEQINRHYKQMEEYMESKNQLEMMDCYRTQADQDLYQIKCQKNKEEELVRHILNKAKYVNDHPDQFFCKIVSAMALPKKFPGLIFLEGKDLETIRKSIQNFKGLNLNTLKKIDFQIYSHLFEEAYQRINDFKVEQYVKVKCGAYKDDIGQITQVNKNGVVLQLIPRISFQLIDLRMKEMDDLRGTQEETHIFNKKNQILKRLTSPKVTYKPGELPLKKKLTQSDFFKYNEFPHNKNIKITEGGLILASYSFNQIGYPKTTVSAKQILQLNPQTDNPQLFLKQQAKNIKLECDIRPNEMVEIIAGQLKGIFGRVHERTNKLVRIICLNSDIKGTIIDQLLQNLSKKFISGERVVVVQGANKGEQGIVFDTHKNTVSILTDNNQRLQCLKRNIRSHAEAKVKFQNDFGVKVDSLIKIRNEIGIVCAAKKTYIQYVDTKNQLLRAKNGEFDVINRTNSACMSKDCKQIRRNCLVQILHGQKQNLILKVKHVYSGFVFLDDPNSLHNYGNWVQKGEECLLYVKNAPRNEFSFLNINNLRKPEFFTKMNPFSKRKNTEDQNDEFKAGNNYRLLQGVYKGIKGVIISTSKDYIEVRVLRDKIVRVARDALKGKGNIQDDRRSEVSVTSNYVRNKKVSNFQE